MNSDPFGIEKKGPPRVPRGARVAPKGARAGKRKAKPPIGRGNYIKAPLLRDKVTNPRWAANAVLNNPGNALAGAGIGGGSLVLLNDRRVSKRDTKKDVAAGAAAGAGAGHFARVGADYGSKSLAERQFKPLTTKGNYGPYTDTEHKPLLNKYKRTVKGNVRQKAKMFDENFPKGVPSYRARKAGVLLNRKSVMAGAAVGGAALGGATVYRKKVKKSYVSFEEFSKAKKKNDQAVGSALVGAGGVTAATGFVAGGIPGTKPDVSLIERNGPILLRPPGDTKKEKLKARFNATKKILPASKGGILGARIEAHDGQTKGFKAERIRGYTAPRNSPSAEFHAGRIAGKVHPERQIVRSMQTGRKAGYAALAGGAATAAYGARKMHKDSVHKSQKTRDRAAGGAIGVGAGGIGVGVAGRRILGGQGKRWRGEEKKFISQAEKLIPETKGMNSQQVSDAADAGKLKHVPKGTLHRAGQLRGAAGQYRHFAHVYEGATLKSVSALRPAGAAVAAAGAGGLYLSNKKKIKKSHVTSAFGVDHG